jgi:hypothetical protein
MKKTPTKWYLSKITIGGTEVEVQYDSRLTEFGTYQSHPHPLISIGDQSESVVAQTLFHECIHAISDLYALDLSEEKVRVLEQCVVAVLVQNPVLASKLLSRDH